MVSDRTSETVDEYVATLDADRRPIIEAIRSLVVENLPDGYVEQMLWGMPTYVIPLERYPDTYPSAHRRDHRGHAGRPLPGDLPAHPPGLTHRGRIRVT